MASQPMGFLDLPKDIRLMLYEYLPLEIRRAHVYLSEIDENFVHRFYPALEDPIEDDPFSHYVEVNNVPAVAHPTQFERDNSVALPYRAPLTNICLTCKTINQEASVFFENSNAYKRKIESYAMNNAPQIIDAYTFSTYSPWRQFHVQRKMVLKIICDLISMSWNMIERHDGQREEISAAPASEFSSSMFVGPVPGKGHLQFLRQMSLYLLKQCWVQDYVPSDDTIRYIDPIRVALRAGKENPANEREFYLRMDEYVMRNQHWLMFGRGMPTLCGKSRRIVFQLIDPEVSEANQLCDSNAVDNASDRIFWRLDEINRILYPELFTRGG